MAWAAWAPVVAAAIQAIASRQANKQSGAQKDIESTLAGNLKATSPMGLDLLGKASGGYDELENVYRMFAKGDRSRLLDFFGPELLSEDSDRRNAMSMSAALAPRGGGSAERRVGMLDDAFTRRNNTFMALRPQGYAGLQGLAESRGSLGTSVLGLGSSTGLGLLGSILQNKGLKFNQDRASGDSLFEILKLFSNRGSGTTAGSPGTTSSIGQYDTRGPT